MRASAEERFWSKVERTETCWLWTGSLFHDGYGKFRDGQRSVRAHRWAYERAHGLELPSSVVLRHACDTPRCVRPEHLSVGSQAENMADKVERRRQARGETQGGAALTEAVVRRIRQAHAAGLTLTQIAERVGVGRTCVSEVVARKTWRHL